jgi:hypothetical protein
LQFSLEIHSALENHKAEIIALFHVNDVNFKRTIAEGLMNISLGKNDLLAWRFSNMQRGQIYCPSYVIKNAKMISNRIEKSLLSAQINQASTRIAANFAFAAKWVGFRRHRAASGADTGV